MPVLLVLEAQLRLLMWKGKETQRNILILENRP